MPSVVEQILTRVHALLLAADVAGENVFRNRTDPLGEDELPGIKVMRGTTDNTAHARGVDRCRFEFSVAHLVTGADVETQADALHMASHAAIFADTQLAALGVDLRCTGTDTVPDDADVDAYRLTARYQIQFLTRPGDLTRSIQ